MKRYEVLVGGQVVATYSKREDAEKHLYRLRNSIFALVHPVDCMGIREK